MHQTIRASCRISVHYITSACLDDWFFSFSNLFLFLHKKGIFRGSGGSGRWWNFLTDLPPWLCTKKVVNFPCGISTEETFSLSISVSFYKFPSSFTLLTLFRDIVVETVCWDGRKCMESFPYIIELYTEGRQRERGLLAGNFHPLHWCLPLFDFLGQESSGAERERERGRRK